MRIKKVILGLILMIALTFFVSNVRADSYELYCLEQGQVIDLPRLCNPDMEPRSGPLNICMHVLDNGKICPASINSCNNLNLGCTNSGGNATIDETAPIVIISSPVAGEIYSDKSVLLDANPNERSTMAYTDNSDPNSGWKQICSSCTSYSQERTFKEGFNNITLRAADGSGNIAYYDFSFYVDSGKPKMGKTEPKSGFASGMFYAEFQEQNPLNFKLKYGNIDSAFREESIDIGSDCTNENGKYKCNVTVDLSDFDEETIEYNFEIEDIAHNIAVSKTIFLLVDYSAPVINSLGYVIEGKNVIFSIDVTEQNIDKIVYIENNDPKAKEKTICSGPQSNLCEKKVSFKDGNHDINVTAKDKAGNKATQNLFFFTDSKTPKIKKTEPKKGFASGMFFVQFQEENPLTLKLLIEDSNILETNIDLNTCLFSADKNIFDCNVDVDLTSYDGQQIKYWFDLADKVNNSVSSKPVFLMVDTTLPVINNINYTIDGMTAIVTVDVTEINLDEITYKNNDDLTIKEKSFCTSLKENKCSKKITLNSGDNDISFNVYDDAGNAIAQNIVISV